MFLSLGAVAAGLIGLAMRDAASFAAARDGLITSWESQKSLPEFLVAARTNHALSNLSFSPVFRSDPHG